MRERERWREGDREREGQKEREREREREMEREGGREREREREGGRVYACCAYAYCFLSLFYRALLQLLVCCPPRLVVF